MEILSQIQKKDPYSIPRINSKKSKEIFKKLLSREAIDTIINSILNKKIDSASLVYNKLLDLYVEPGLAFQGYNYEVIPVTTFGFLLNLQLYNRIHEFDSQGKFPTQDLSSYYDYYVEIVCDFINFLSYSNTLLESEIRKALTNVKKYLPQVVITLDEKRKKSVINCLKYQAENNDVDFVRDEINSLIKEID